MSEPFIGEIKLFAGNFAPRGWALCDGQLLPISSNSALFSILGTTYGGDGRTTFALPELRGRVPVHPGTGPGLSNYRLGQKSGAETNTLTANNMPAHSHNINQASAAEGDSNVPAGNLLARTDARSYTSTGPAVATGGATDNAGGGQAVNNIQPYQAVNYIIALNGIYPSRS